MPQECPMSIDQANDLIGDDIAFWLNNPFMSRSLAEKVAFWIGKAFAEGERRGCATALEMARKAELAERRAEDTEAEIERLRELLTSGGQCAHDWLDRPESDTRECLICGIEVAG